MQPSLIPSGISGLSVELLPDSYKSNEILPNALFVGLLTDGCAKADESINGTNASHFNIALHVKERDKRVEGFLGRTREIVLGFGICHVARAPLLSFVCNANTTKEKRVRNTVIMMCIRGLQFISPETPPAGAHVRQ